MTFSFRQRVLPLVASMVAISPLCAQAETVVIDGFTFVVNEPGIVYWEELGSGIAFQRIDIVIMGDGFTLAEQDEFVTRMKEMLDELWGTYRVEPFATWKCAFNVWSVQIVSDVSGIGNGPTPLRTALAAPDQPARYIAADKALCERACVAAGVPGWDVIVVIANAADVWAAWFVEDLICVSSGLAWGVILGHELGHVVADLADEYDCYLCNDTEGSRTYPGPEPLEPNLTIHSTVADRARIPWNSMIHDCADLPTTPEGAFIEGTVGAWQGAGTYANGLYRPSEYCLMNDVCHYYSTFCKVCEKAVRDRLRFKCMEVVPGTTPPEGVSEHVASSISTFVLEGMLDPSGVVVPGLLPIAEEIPPCPKCDSPRLVEAIQLKLSGFDTARARLYVYDDTGALVAQADGSAVKSLEVNFTASKLHTYRFVLVPGVSEREIRLRAELTRDGVPFSP